MPPTVIAGMIVCDFKHYQLKKTLYRLGELTNIDAVYLNVETQDQDLYRDLIENWPFDKPLHFDYWNVTGGWRPERKYDQHQVRLMPICTARNMCIDYAMTVKAKHLLFVDSDVLLDHGGVNALLSLNKDLCGGYVNGRGSHKDAVYVFGQRGGIKEINDEVIECDHGTCGYMLVARKCFSQLRFRWGMHPDDPTNMLSEDPAYCFDWKRISNQRFYIHKKATATHLDNDKRPLTINQTVNVEDDWTEDILLDL